MQLASFINCLTLSLKITRKKIQDHYIVRHFASEQLLQNGRRKFNPFNTWCSLKGHTDLTNQQLKAAGLLKFKYIWRFSGHQALKGLIWRRSRTQMYYRMTALKTFGNFTWNNTKQSNFLGKVSEILKNNYFEKHLLTDDSNGLESGKEFLYPFRTYSPIYFNAFQYSISFWRVIKRDLDTK